MVVPDRQILLLALTLEILRLRPPSRSCTSHAVCKRTVSTARHLDSSRTEWAREPPLHVLMHLAAPGKPNQTSNQPVPEECIEVQYPSSCAVHGVGSAVRSVVIRLPRACPAGGFLLDLHRNMFAGTNCLTSVRSICDIPHDTVPPISYGVIGEDM